MSSRTLQGRNVLITGGSSGLGAALIEAVRADGGTPWVLDRVAPQSEVEHEIVDLGDPRAAEAAVAEVVGRAGTLDAVVTAAGTDRCGRIEDVPGEDWDRVVMVNLLGTAAVVRAAMPALLASRGKVVTIASTLGWRALSDATAYCASKFGVVGFTRALNAETQGRIGVTLVLPGGMQTAFFDDRDPQYKPGPDAKLNNPQDVAQVILMALNQPEGCELREVMVSASVEPSWP